MTNKENIILSNEFGVYESDNEIELESWTNCGVNMFIYLNKNTDESITEQFKYFVEGFNIDEEIDIHRQGKDYRDTFSITESVNDFTDYKNWLNVVLKELENDETDIKILCDTHTIDELKTLYINDFNCSKHMLELMGLIEDYKLRTFLVDLFEREYSFEELRNKLYKIKWVCDYE